MGRVAILLGLILGLQVVAGCEGSSEEPPPNILLITVDTLRADHTSLLEYERDTTPRLRAFFADGRVYDRAYATEANTSPSVMSILSGLHPQNHRVRLLFQKADPTIRLLPDYLGDVGYRTGAIVSNIVLTDEALGLGDRFDHFDDFVDEELDGWAAYERVGERTTNAALAWLSESGEQPDRDRPLFLWVHYIDPHGPYRPPKGTPANFEHDGFVPIEARRIQRAHRREGIQDALEFVDRYDEEIAYTDQQIGRLLDGFAEMGFADHAITLFTADHGETMMEFEKWFSHGYHVYEPILRVPLAIRGAGLEPDRVSTPVSLAGLVPTLLELAEVETEETFDAASFAGDVEAGPVFGEATDGGGGGRQWRMMIRGDDKFVARIETNGRVSRRIRFPTNLEGRQSNPWLPNDPRGRALLSLIASDPDPAGMPADLERGVQLNAPKVAPGLDETNLERLRALGYVE